MKCSFLTNRHPKVLLDLESVWLVNILFLVQAIEKYHSAVPGSAIYFHRSQHKPGIDRKKILVSSLLTTYCGMLPSALIFNWGATTFSCRNDL